MLFLETITQDNWRLVANLSVTKEQINFIELNSDSLLEAAFDEKFNWMPLALYDEAILVGFAMIGDFNEDQKSIWLDRLMIDQHFQGKKYGTQFLKLILNFIKDNWSVKTIILSAHKENQSIFSFYEAFGFKNTHKVDKENGEIIMILEC
ncbi:MULTISPECIES: GNAT family N-acetyltransferase [Vagococcus]|uniref:Spermine/spermidine acetyltransferase n=1 Tax=Vagococcus fluvialis bH819 TaxID=1255619 RepID=A0A1X6WKG0_9ENTE|nr:MULTISPECIES: GNAT family N-acetyltransferase [Vagococcus]SLM84755.1 spermine/spermidine acetyltransferase [Vagococcus fluvialis bH819]HCM89784.1 GNAT family N-acetyltransferase [Vagococcus sp.]